MLPRRGGTAPLISVIMPARNAADHIVEALSSIQSQSVSDFEVLVIDDGSTDGTADLVRSAAARDPRINLLQGDRKGPGAARNLGLEAAKGDWAAIVDADDLIDPLRFERLLAGAQAGQTEIVADNLLAFFDDGRPDHVWLAGAAWTTERVITLEAYLDSDTDGRDDQLGYLKPIFRLEWFRARRLAYDETLTIGEDYDLVLRALVAGAVYRFVPSIDYRYRRHSRSTSYRITPSHLKMMIVAMHRTLNAVSGGARTRVLARLQALELDLSFSKLIEDIKRGRPAGVVAGLRSAPLRRRLWNAIGEGLMRRLRSAPLPR